MVIFTGYRYFKYKRPKNKFIVLYFAFFIYLIVGQTITFLYLPLFTTIGLFVRISISYFVVRILKERFIEFYINVIYFWAIVSLVFYSLIIVVPGFEAFMVSNIAPYFEHYFYDTSFYKPAPQIILYTFNTRGGVFVDFVRNAGPFWEAGAFAGFLILALLFNLVKEKNMWVKKNIIFYIAVITTFSTTGYIALFMTLAGFSLLHAKARYKFSLLPMVLFISFYSFIQLDFLESKITHQINKINPSNIQYQSRSRFVSAILDFQDIVEYPFFGRGRNVNTRYDYTDSFLRHRNNGVTGFFVQFGVIGGFLFFFLILKSFKSLCRYYKMSWLMAYLSLMIIITLGFSENYFTKPLFFSLPMLWLVYDQLPRLNKAKEYVI